MIFNVVQVLAFESCRQDAGFNTINPAILVPAGKVWLNDVTAPPVVCLRIYQRTSGQCLCCRRSCIDHKLCEQEETSQTDCSKMADAEPPPFWSLFVVSVLFVVCVVVICFLSAFASKSTKWTSCCFVVNSVSRTLARFRRHDDGVLQLWRKNIY